MALYLTFFGSFQARSDNAAITQFRGDKVRALLAYLAVEAGRPHARAALCGLLWPDQGDDAALQNLSQSLGRLRTALGDGDGASHLLSTRRTIQWNAHGGAIVDVTEFVRLASSANIAELEQAVALYRGPFLPGFSIAGCPEFEEWLLLTREQCERLALSALETLAETWLAAGRYREAEHAARRVLGLDPWRETAHRQVMAALAGAGRRGAALAQYDICAQTLADELGYEPDEATTALYEAIRDGTWQPAVAAVAPARAPVEPAPATPDGSGPAASPAPEAAAASPCELPAPLGALVGRERELAQLVACFEQGERLVTLAGMGGVGKTRLALEAAHRLAEHADVCWVALAGTGARAGAADDAGAETVTEAATVIAGALGLSLSGEQPVSAQVLRALRRRELLLVLDNLEHLLDITPWLLDLLQRAPSVRLLITSRERLNVDAEVVVPLAGLGLPERDDDPDAASYSAVKLFRQRAARAAPSFDANDELEAVVRLCRLLDGVPLGLELAAHWVAHYRVDEITAAVVDNLDFLTSTRRDYPERQRSLRAAFGYSWQLLTAPEQQAMARLSVLRGSFSREAAQAVAQTDAAVLAALVDKSLLRQAGVGSYVVHELLRQFSAEQLAAQGDDEATCARHAEYFLELVARSELGLAGTATREAVATLRATFENIRAAWYWALGRRRWTRMLHSVTGLMLYFRVTGPIQALQTADDALAALHAADAADAAEPACATVRLRLQAALQVARARVCEDLAQVPQAIHAAQRAIACAQAAGDVLEAARAKLVWGMALANQRTISTSDGGRAGALLQDAISGARAIDTADPVALRRAGEVQGESMKYLVELASREQRYDDAVAWFSAALQILRDTGNQYCLESLFSYHASTYEQQGELGQGRLNRELALEYARSCGTRDGEGSCLHNLARALDYSGEYALARQYSTQAIAIASRLGFQPHWEHHLFAKTAVHQGDFVTALEAARQSLHESRATSDPLIGGPVLVTIGDALTGMRRWSEAHAAFDEAISLAQRLGADDDKTLYAAHAGLARIALAQRDFDRARAHAEFAWSWLRTHPFDISYDPLRRYWTCYLAFRAAGDRRAVDILEEAYTLLMRLAGSIEPSRRRSFLEQVTSNRAIARRWSAVNRSRQAGLSALAVGA